MTAGPHHAIAHHDVYIGFDHFGFLNLLLAVAAAQKDAGTNEVGHILAEQMAETAEGIGAVGRLQEVEIAAIVIARSFLHR